MGRTFRVKPDGEGGYIATETGASGGGSGGGRFSIVDEVRSTIRTSGLFGVVGMAIGACVGVYLGHLWLGLDVLRDYKGTAVAAVIGTAVGLWCGSTAHQIADELRNGRIVRAGLLAVGSVGVGIILICVLLVPLSLLSVITH